MAIHPVEQVLDDPIGEHGVGHFLEARDVCSLDVVNCAWKCRRLSHPFDQNRAEYSEI